MVRIAHLSDVHLTASPLGLAPRDFLSKRFGTLVNMRLRRGKNFRLADEVTRAFERDCRQRGIDAVIFSGDATNFGLPNEMARAAEMLGVGRMPGLAVPGNHDYLVEAAERSGAFERGFAPWQQGTRLDGQIYPFAKKVGEAWFIGVNSARANRWSWDATGLVDAAELDRLTRLLAELSPGPRIWVTQYPIALKNGSPETPSHGLVNLDEVLAIAKRGSIACWLHGHRHGFYHLDNPLGCGIPAICIGSATQHGNYCYGDYAITADRLSATCRIYDPALQAFRDGATFAIELSGPNPSA